MSLSRIRTNLQAQVALQNLQSTNNRVGDIQEKLQTGKRINKAADDSAGYSIAAKLRARVGGQAQALRNVGDAKSIMSVAEGGMNTIQDMLQQMKEKVVQGANDSNGAEERKAIRTELKALTNEIKQTLEETTFNGNKLFTDDDAGTDFTFQVNAEKGDTFDVNIERLSDKSLSLMTSATTAKLVGKDLAMSALTASDLSFGSAASIEAAEFEVQVESVAASPGGGTYTIELDVTGSGKDIAGADIDVSNTVTTTLSGAGAVTIAAGGDLGAASSNDVTLNIGTTLASQLTEGSKIFASVDGNELNVVDNDTAGDSLSVIDSAISEISKAVSNLGDAQNRLNFKADNLNTAMINNEAARSQIEDADFAAEQVQLAKTQILQQTNVSALAQANAAPQSVLSLVG